MDKEIKVVGSRDVINSEWYQLLVDDCAAIITEASFTARWALVEGYHELGLRILEDIDKFKNMGVYGKQVVKMVAGSMNKSERTVYYAIQFVERYPDMNSLPEGKAITWSKICKKYLPQNKGECPHDFEEVVIKVCKCCGKKIEEKGRGWGGVSDGAASLYLP